MPISWGSILQLTGYNTCPAQLARLEKSLLYLHVRRIRLGLGISHFYIRQTLYSNVEPTHWVTRDNAVPSPQSPPSIPFLQLYK